MQNLRPVTLKRRTAALMYEALLVGAITAFASLVAGVAAMGLNTLSPLLSSLAVTLILMASWWYYFKLNWHKKGQTLPMQVWKIGLADLNGIQPALPQLRLRFMWACVFIVFVPLLAYLALRYLMGVPPKTAFGAALIWWILPWGFAWFNSDRQFLYDYLAGTRLVDLKQPPQHKKTKAV